MTRSFTGYDPLTQTMFFRDDTPAPKVVPIRYQSSADGTDWQHLEAFIRSNPSAHRRIIRRVIECVDAGNRRGVKGIFEDVRANAGVDGVLDNNLTALYARWLMARGIAPDGWFELRTAKADEETR